MKASGESLWFITEKNRRKREGTKGRIGNHPLFQYHPDLLILGILGEEFSLEGGKVAVYEEHNLPDGKHQRDRIVEIGISAALIDPEVPEEWGEKEAEEKHVEYQETVAEMLEDGLEDGDKTQEEGSVCQGGV